MSGCVRTECKSKILFRSPSDQLFTHCFYSQAYWYSGLNNVSLNEHPVCYFLFSIHAMWQRHQLKVCLVPGQLSITQLNQAQQSLSQTILNMYLKQTHTDNISTGRTGPLREILGRLLQLISMLFYYGHVRRSRNTLNSG